MEKKEKKKKNIIIMEEEIDKKKNIIKEKEKINPILICQGNCNDCRDKKCFLI